MSIFTVHMANAQIKTAKRITKIMTEAKECATRDFSNIHTALAPVADDMVSSIKPSYAKTHYWEQFSFGFEIYRFGDLHIYHTRTLDCPKTTFTNPYLIIQAY